MNKEKDMKEFSSKRALLLSVISMVICVSMLIGSTFAWFTDSATANVNTIKSGNLDVELVDANGEKITEALKWVKSAEAPAGEKILWEPGCTYNLESFKIANKGDLALKYKVVISGLTGDATLLNAIDFTVKKGDAEVSLDNFTGKLLPAGKTATADDEEVGETALITITGTMKATAGNEYKGLSLEGISITVYATQLAYESDSKGNTYDKDATYYPVIDEAGLRDALKAGGNVSVEADFTTDETKTSASDRTTIKVPTTINLNGTITVPGSLEASNNWAALYISADTTINAGNGGGIYCANKTDASASYAGGPFVANVVNGSTVTVNGGTYYGGCTTFQVEKGTLIVNGGFFSVYPDIDTNDYRYVLNCIDASYNNGTAKIIVKGGTFVNFDPSNNAAEGAGTNFVAEGYSVIKETQANGDVWYTVVKDTTVSTSNELTAAIRSAVDGDTIRLGANITATSAFSIGKNITVDLNGYTLSSTALNTLKLTSGANVTVVDNSTDKTGLIANEYSGSSNATTVDLKGSGTVFTLKSGKVQSNSKDSLYSIAIANSGKKKCTVNIYGGTVANCDSHENSRAISASNGMTVNIYDGVINGGLYALDTYAGSVSNIFGGTLSANAKVARDDEYGQSYAIHSKGEASITIGSADVATIPSVKGIKFESSGVNTELPTIKLVKGEITNPVYSLEAKYNYSLFKLDIAADAPVTFTDSTASFFLADGLEMVSEGSVWKVTSK